MKRKISFWAAASIILAFLLICTITYICVTKYREARESEKLEIFNQGAEYGYESAIIEMMQKAANCEPISLYAGNETIEVLNVNCPNK